MNVACIISWLKRACLCYPFGSGAGGNVDGYGMMLHRALKPYEDMVSRGEKPFMALMKQSELQSVRKSSGKANLNKVSSIL